MTLRSDSWPGVLTVLLLATAAYFVAYPQDLAPVLNPLDRVLALTQSIAPGFYAVIAVAILAWAAVRIWGRALPPP